MELIKNLTCIVLLLLPFMASGRDKKVLIIGVDGCRPDALIAANTPNIDALIANGAFTSVAETRPVTSSGPGWSNMLTGVWQDKHGVYDNSFSNDHYDEFPHFFDRLKAFDPSLHCVSIVRWSPIQSEIPKNADVDLAITSSDEDVAAAAAEYIITNDDLDAMFVHLDDIDHAGHHYGYDPDNADYLRFIEKTDGLVGSMVQAVFNRSSIDLENWLIIVATDHGGIGFGHGGGTEEERTIFIVVSGDSASDFRLDALNEKEETGQIGIGRALVMDGNGFGKINGNDFRVSALDDFTVEVMVKSSGWTGDPAILSDKDWNDGYLKGMVLAARSDGKIWKFNIGDGTDRIDLNGAVISDGAWHHLAVSFDKDGNKILYQDGKMSAITNKVLGGDFTSGLDLGIGQDGTTQYNYTFRGEIGDIRVWNKALSAEAISGHICTSIDQHPDRSLLQAHWTFDAMNNHSIEDISGHNRSIDVTGGLQLSGSNNVIHCYEFSERPGIVDVAVTALTHMGVPIDPAWELDGQPFGLVTTEDKDKPPLYLFPNPNGGRFRIDMDMDEAVVYAIAIAGTSGRTVLPPHTQQGHSANVDISGCSEGLYIITIQTLFGTERRKLLIQR